MLRSLVMAWLVVVCVAPTFANAQSIFLYQNFVIPVIDVDSDTFEAIENDGAGGVQMWCAAAIYARRVLGIERGGEISVKQARGPSQFAPGRKSVIFTVAPVADPIKTYDLTVRRVGKVMSIAAANAQCRSDFREVVIRLRNGQYVYW